MADTSLPRGAIMMQGTGSDVGKSLLVAGLARALVRRGLRVRPFKPQNMSNNAAVTLDGGEIGRAQALQAQACGVPPHSLMNPVLLKPQSDVGAQVVVRGQVLTNATARDYYRLKPTLLPTVLESFAHLSAEADIVLVEGAGSAAEVNLRQADIANMGFAEAADVPVVLVADIDRGGVIASLVGTWAVLPPLERRRIKGYIINKFRGDPALFQPAIDIIAHHTGWRCFGIVPWFAQSAMLPAEDGASLRSSRKTGHIQIAIPRLPRLANFDDFDPLAAEPGVSVEMIPAGQPLPATADLIILPGSKATIADLAFFRDQGWDIDLKAHVRRQGRVLGICAGYQMLGRRLCDPLGVEGLAGSECDGLGLLDVQTHMAAEKVLQHVRGISHDGYPVQGYEMHMGRTDGPDCRTPFAIVNGQPDGAIHPNGLVAGCYLHGLFASNSYRQALLQSLKADFQSTQNYQQTVESVLDHLAEHLEQHLDIPALLSL